MPFHQGADWPICRQARIPMWDGPRMLLRELANHNVSLWLFTHVLSVIVEDILHSGNHNLLFQVYGCKFWCYLWYYGDWQSPSIKQMPGGISCFPFDPLWASSTSRLAEEVAGPIRLSPQPKCWVGPSTMPRSPFVIWFVPVHHWPRSVKMRHI